MIHQCLVKIIAAQVVVTGGGQHFDDTAVDIQDGDIKGSATQVEDHDLLRRFFVNAISQSSSSRFVDDTLYVQSCDGACIFGSLALCICKISRYRNHSIRDFFPEIITGIVLQLLKNHG